MVECQYSTKVTKLFRSNAVSVLSALVLLSYVKIMRRNTSIVSPAKLEVHQVGTVVLGK